MSTNPPTVISESNLSVAWARALQEAIKRSNKELAPLMVSIGGFSGAPAEDEEIGRLFDAARLRYKKKRIFSATVSASTIFPWAFWRMNRSLNCKELANKYLVEILPRLKDRDTLNKHGTYFERMVNFGGNIAERISGKNQLDHIVELWRKRRDARSHPRHSAMVVSCLDPQRDQSLALMRGFPCLQQVSFGYDNSGGLSVSAYYPTQYIFDRAYGNYLGLGHLGQFMASQLGVKLVRINVFVGRPELGSPGKGDLEDLSDAISKRLEKIEGEKS